MIDFKFNIDEVGLIMKGLLELPAKESLDLILKIDQTVAAAQKKEDKLPDKNNKS